MRLGEGKALGGILRPPPGVPGHGYSRCGPLLESVHKWILTHGDTAWKPRVGTEKLIAVIVLLGLLNLHYRIGACMLYSFCGFHFIFLICFHRILQKRRLC